MNEVLSIWQAIVLALVQGLTEFLPVSSSAHLILPSKLLGWPDQGLAFDVAVHVGTLLAVLAYFYRDLKQMAVGSVQGLVQRNFNDDLRLVCLLVLATVPAGLIGFLANDWIEIHLRSTTVIAWATIGFGGLLWAAFLYNKKLVNLKGNASLTVLAVLLIGCAQALALIPGTSRSGITITMAMLLGFSPIFAARFSFLLSIPLILAAGLLKTVELVFTPGDIRWGLISLGLAVSGVSAYLCIRLFIRLLDRVGMMPFVVYRLLLGVVLLAFAAG